MKLILILLATLVPFLSSGQNKNKIFKKSKFYDLLYGKWRSVDDNRWVIEFTKSGHFYSTIKGSPDTLFFTYKLYSSCQLKDTSGALKLSNTSTMSLILSSIDNSALDECDEIEDLDKGNLSWMNSENGKVFVFQKILRHKATSTK